ncbi:MAG TPA: hypothetical protein VNK43_08365 [Gemmatimonadales bacterium]|nr:hypothetical protein [Gemmatimonadales bacterium]
MRLPFRRPSRPRRIRPDIRPWLVPLALAAAACREDSGGGLDPPDDADQGTSPTPGCVDGTLESGALFRICFPGQWNGDLVVYAHGYVSAYEPIALPDDRVEGRRVEEIVQDLGYAYATTSYRANGLAVTEAVEDLRLLEATVRARYRPDPPRTYLVGVSEGGLVATLGVERAGEPFDGALAACGPIGDFRHQIDYIGDFRVVFDYFFPGVLPGSPVLPPDEVRADWDRYGAEIARALLDDPIATLQLLRVTGASVDPGRPATVGATVLGLLWYNVFAAPDLQQRLGGQPFDNTSRVYAGSLDDAALNAGVARFAADLAANRNVAERLTTTGHPTVPLVALHTDRDPVVPVEQQRLYGEKVAQAGLAERVEPITVERYGHCAFTLAELTDAFTRLVERVAAEPHLAGVLGGP